MAPRWAHWLCTSRICAVHVAREQQRLAADAGRDEVAGIPDLALVADIDPCRAEDALELELENLRIGVEPAVHPAGLDQRTDGFARWHGATPGPLPPKPNAPVAGRKGPRAASVPIPSSSHLAACSTRSSESKGTRNGVILVPLLNPKFAFGFAANVCERRVRGTGWFVTKGRLARSRECGS